VLLGTLLVTWCPVMLVAARLPRIAAGGRLDDGVAGAAGGLLGGLGGFTGAIPTLWCTLRGFDKDTQRAVIQNFNLTMLAMTFAGYLASGIVTAPMLPLFALGRGRRAAAGAARRAGLHRAERSDVPARRAGAADARGRRTAGVGATGAEAALIAP
jgi:hypothetical protein